LVITYGLGYYLNFYTSINTHADGDAITDDADDQSAWHNES